MKHTSYEDYKYVMMDTTSIYLGAKYSYGELMDNDEVLFKLQTVLKQYILTEIDGETTLESHFYHMGSNEFSYKTYRQLRVKVKVSRLTTKKSLFGKERSFYTSEIIPLDKFVVMPKEEKERQGIMIQEIIISKLALMGFMV